MESSTVSTAHTEFVIAYSGGVDSHVLLLCCHRLGLNLRAVHVHHGLQEVAAEWVEHCQRVCDGLSIPLEICHVDAKKKYRQSPEESARNARYEALIDNLRSGECLLTAQHQDDQAETLLLQLFRAASTAGLSAMPLESKRRAATHLRPLLSFTRSEIVDFAQQQGLHWVEDPTNQNSAYDRNYLRNEIMPKLGERWPGIAGRLSTAASLQASNLTVLNDMAAIDLTQMTQSPEVRTVASAFEIVSCLSLLKLRSLSSARRMNLLRYWLTKSSPKASVSRRLLEEFERVMLDAPNDRSALLTFSGHELRVFRDGLYLLRRDAEVDQSLLDETQDWDINEVVAFAISGKKIRLVESRGRGLDKHKLDGSLTIAYRRGGESFHPAGRQHSQRLKKLFLEAGVAYWDRDALPLIYQGETLVAVADLWTAKDYTVAEDGTGLRIEIY